MATFDKTRAPTFRTYVAEKEIVMPNWLKTFQIFWSHSSAFTLEKQPEKLNFRPLLPPKDSLVATLYGTRARTSRKYAVEQGIVMPNWSKTFQSFWSHSSVFALEKQPKNLNYSEFFQL